MRSIFSGFGASAAKAWSPRAEETRRVRNDERFMGVR
jgi:hypothetical protein